MATASIPVPDINLAPDFIRFLFSTKPKFDCYFKVGNDSHGKPERIGGVKLMLMAHSEVFRLELEESVLKEKEDVPVKDINPDTFRGLLKYVYGHDTTKDMCFDEADNLFYVAEKYMIKTLKDKLAVRLMDLLNPDNICSLLNNPACHTHLELDSAITKILRYETDQVLASPQFPWMNADGFLMILEQDGLAVPEIELWRAAIKWARHRANAENGQALRQQLSGLTQHLRLCTFTVDEVLAEVVPSDVLTKDELKAVCQYVGRKERPQSVSNFSSEIEPRKLLQKTKKTREELELSRLFMKANSGDWLYIWKMLTKKSSIELLPLVCRSKTGSPEQWTYRIGCTITITEVTNPDNSSANVSSPVTVTFSGIVECENVFEIPLTVGGRNITLQPDSKYKVEMHMDGWHTVYHLIENGSGSYRNSHIALDVTPFNCCYSFPSSKLVYRVVTPLEEPLGS